VLVLSRKVGESLVIDDKVQVKIVNVRGNQVRVGVEAPGSVSIVREELFRAIASANRKAARRNDGAISALASSLRVSQDASKRGGTR